MTFDEYERHVREQLCWRCHAVTQVSHRLQRQCSRCRAKWSYKRRLLQLDLLALFSRHFNAHEASGHRQVSYSTAWTHFFLFEKAIRRSSDSAAAREFLQDPLLRDREVRELLKRYRENRTIGEVIYRALIQPPQ